MTFYSCEGTTVTRERLINPDVLQYVKENREEGFFNDVIITAGSESIPGNRLILSCYSSFFEKMFKTEMKEKYEETVEIKGFDGSSLKALIDFIYSGTITIGNDNVMDLIAAADYLQMDEVKNFCFDFLESSLTLDNCLAIFDAAAMYRHKFCNNLRVQRFMSKNFFHIVRSSAFKTANKDTLLSCISYLDRSQTNETYIYEAVVNWTKQDIESRQVSFLELLKLVNLDKVPLKYLEENVSKEKLIEKIPGCLNLVISAVFKSFQRNLIIENDESKIVCLGGFQSPGIVKEIYNCRDESFVVYPQLPKTLRECCAIRLQNCVYCIDGCNSALAQITRVWKMDLKEEILKWKEVTPLGRKRGLVTAEKFKDALVVAGGVSGFTVMASTEVYILQLDEWKEIASMNQSRYGNALVSCNDCLYAIGGANCYYCLSSVERLNDLKDKWESVKTMHTERGRLAAIACDGFIYAIGGRSGKQPHTTLKSVERYDPSTNQWVYVADMNFKRCCHSACVLRGKIFVVGGRNAEEVIVKEIECYDPSDNVWNIVGSTDVEYYNHALIVL